MGNKDATPAAELQALVPLVGVWKVELPHYEDRSKKVYGSTSFEWFQGGKFLIERSQVDDRLYPDGIAIIGYDEENQRYVQRYFDSRGVERTYYMALSDGVWTIWRDDDPNFRQRFTGNFSADGNIIDARWERSSDGENWQLDFPGTYIKET